MAAKLNPWGVCRNLTIRARPLLPSTERRIVLSVPRRGLADDATKQPSTQDSSITTKEYVRPPTEHFASNWLNAAAIAELEKIAAEEAAYERTIGNKFGLPTPPGKDDRLQRRYPEVIDQVTKLLMRDGKLSHAQRHMSMILHCLRTSPAPKINPARPLMPGAPPPEQLPLNPVLYLTLAIDSVAPLIRVRHLKGIASGGMTLEVPSPITARQRRRQAMLWILDIVNKKKSRGSGKTQFASRIADEIIAVVEGKSAAWDRRMIVHKLGTASRANLNHMGLSGKKKRRSGPAQ
ncbi:ribosomal protein S7 domain-containing protein [Xylariales sp. PMI_506]|nr:ribosomal protein S7 domain-containing protein [Xylariales sp. PMI_506]